MEPVPAWCSWRQKPAKSLQFAENHQLELLETGPVPPSRERPSPAESRGASAGTMRLSCRQAQEKMDAVVRLFAVSLLVVAALAQDDTSTTSTILPELDPSETCAIFGGPACSTEMPGLYNPCDCPDESGERCECVLFYQCDNSTGQYDEDGKGLLDIRKKDGCSEVELRCCKINSSHDKRSPTPHPDFPLPTPPPAGLCGVRNEGGLASKVVNNEGGEAGFGEFPWMVAILLATKSGEQFKCGGALLEANVVITAAHCVKGQAPHKLRIRAGDWDRETTSEIYKHQDRGVSKVLIHDEYYGGNYRYDVALLVLDSPVELGYNVGTLCLPEQGDGSVFDGQRCIVTGWGKDKLEDRWPHRYLKRLELDVVPREECEQKLRVTMLGMDFKLHESFVCAGGEAGKDTCKGDGGSPLVCRMPDGRFQLAGAVAWGVDCGLAGVPGLYANIAAVRQWIDSHLLWL